MIYNGQCLSWMTFLDHIILPQSTKGNKLWAWSSFNMNWQVALILAVRWFWNELSAASATFFIESADFLIIYMRNLNSAFANTLLVCDDFPYLLTTIFLTLLITSSILIDFVGFPLIICTLQPNSLCRGSSSDTTANKINPYYLIGSIFLYIFIFLY